MPEQDNQEASLSNRLSARRTGNSSLLSKFVLSVSAFAIAALILGYPAFRGTIAAYHVDEGEQLQSSSLPESAKPDATEGIVVLTGDRARIATGLGLLEAGLGKRLLVSGVHEHTSRAAVFKVGGYEEAKLPCCVDIGYSATSTTGNAEEARQWVKRHGISTLLVVTSDYHMPRSLLEFSHAMPDITLIPHVAQTDLANEASGTNHGKSDFLRHSLREYGKYLVAHGRLLTGAEGLESIFTAKAAD